GGDGRLSAGVYSEPHVHDPPGAEHGGERHAARESLSYANEIRHDALVFEGEAAARAPEPGEDLVGDEEPAAALGLSAQGSQETGRRNHLPASALDGLDDHGAGVGPRTPERRAGIAVGTPGGLGRKQEGKGPAKRGPPGQRKRQARVAVISAFE